MLAQKEPKSQRQMQFAVRVKETLATSTLQRCILENALFRSIWKLEPVNNQCFHLVYIVQVVAKAKVPIIKFIEEESNVNFDISFDVPNGPIAAGFVRDLMDTLPPMKPLVLVLKIFLQQRQFNEVRHWQLASRGHREAKIHLCSMP